MMLALPTAPAATIAASFTAGSLLSRAAVDDRRGGRKLPLGEQVQQLGPATAGRA